MKILVADDDKVSRELLGYALKKAGHEVLFAEDGVDAVEQASRERPDIVLMDGLMPKMHGFLACKTIKELVDPPKVVLLTGIYTKVSYKWEAKKTYLADAYINKPFDGEVLLALMETLFIDLVRDRTCLSTSNLAALPCPPEAPSHDSDWIEHHSMPN